MEFNLTCSSRLLLLLLQSWRRIRSEDWRGAQISAQQNKTKQWKTLSHTWAPPRRRAEFQPNSRRASERRLWTRCCSRRWAAEAEKRQVFTQIRWKTNRTKVWAALQLLYSCFTAATGFIKNNRKIHFQSRHLKQKSAFYTFSKIKKLL